MTEGFVVNKWFRLRTRQFQFSLYLFFLRGLFKMQSYVHN